jgi:hypothetical protein
MHCLQQWSFPDNLPPKTCFFIHGLTNKEAYP